MRPWGKRAAKDRTDSPTRTAILDAAETLFTLHGYARTTMAHIADEASVSRATTYVYFASRADVFRALARRVRDEIAEVQRTAAASREPHEIIESSIRAGLQVYAAKSRFLTVLAHQALADDDMRGLAEEIHGDSIDVNARFIALLQQRRQADPAASPHAVAHAVNAIMLRFSMDAADDPAELDRLASDTVAMYCRLVGLER